MSSGDRRIFRMQDHAPNGWKFQSLYDLAEYINGKAFRQSELGDKGLPVIKIAELHNGITASTKYYDGKIEEWFYLKKGELLFAWSGSVGVFTWNGGPAVLNQHIFKVKAKPGIDQKFLKYLLQFHMPIFELLVKDKATTMGHVRIEDLKSIEAAIPPLHEQRKIAEILGSLDDKIELNYEMNKTLEAIAQAIFENWFVDFEPFEDELAYNEELGEEIPRGWEVVRIGDFVHVEKGVSYKSEDLKARSDVGLVNLKCILPGGGFRNEVKPYSGKFEPKHVLRIGDIVVAITDLTQNREVIGMPARIYPVETFKKLVLSLDLVALRIKDEKALKQSFLYYLLLTPRYKGYVNGCAYGTTVRHLKPTDILNFKFALPPYEWIAKFAEIADSIFDLLVHNFMETRVLEEIRDALLPKLLSGEIRVKVDVEEEFPEETKKLEDIGRKKAKIQVSLEEWLRHG
jgi:type I restriction enzyme S subunit